MFCSFTITGYTIFYFSGLVGDSVFVCGEAVCGFKTVTLVGELSFPNIISEVDTKSDFSGLGVAAFLRAEAEEVFYVLRGRLTPVFRADPSTEARPSSINVFNSFRRFSMLFMSALFIFKYEIPLSVIWLIKNF